MGLIINYLVDKSDGQVQSYDTQKRSIEETELDIYGDYEDHSAEGSMTLSKKDSIAETNPPHECKCFLTKDVAKKLDKSMIRYFLDGSRHVYKVGDLAIGGIIYPLVLGQIVVGYAGREQRNMNEGYCDRHIVLAVPRQYNHTGSHANFFRKITEEVNEKLEQSPFFKRWNIKIDSILPYRTDGDVEKGRNKYLHSAITVIQNEMMDLEQLMVQRMCDDNKLNDENWLVKDGTIEYRKDFTNRPDMALDSANFRQKFSHVIGVSKLFNPELLSSVEKNIAKIIADLPPLSRTKAYVYTHESKHYCVWYLRLRDTINRPNRFADIIKVEYMMLSDEKISTNKIDIISLHLLNEAYPVCYGKDGRWANHLYPMHVAETFCKSKYISDQILIKMI